MAVVGLVVGLGHCQVERLKNSVLDTVAHQYLDAHHKLQLLRLRRQQRQHRRLGPQLGVVHRLVGVLVGAGVQVLVALAAELVALVDLVRISFATSVPA